MNKLYRGELMKAEDITIKIITPLTIKESNKMIEMLSKYISNRKEK